MNTIIEKITTLSISNDKVIGNANPIKDSNNTRRAVAGVVLLRRHGKEGLQVLLLKGKNTWNKVGNCKEYTTTRPPQKELDQHIWKFRQGKWGPPKGGVEETDKSLDDAAKRELEEETGRSLEYFKPSLLTTLTVDGNYFLVVLCKKWVTIPNLVLQPDEIHQARWVNLKNWYQDAHYQKSQHNRPSRLLSEKLSNKVDIKASSLFFGIN